MNTYHPISGTKRLALAAGALAIAAGVLELVVGAMKFPDPERMAVRERVIAAQSERAQQIRELQNGEVRMAAAESDGGTYPGIE